MRNRHLIVAGFHRSGTSMTAQALHRAGLPLGPALVLPHPSNTDGHFEDAEIVEAHEDILGDCGQSWDYGLGGLPHVSSGRTQNLSRIVKDRNRRYGIWGFKDPRVCLFLDTWRHLLGDPCVLVVFRHYESCIASILQRAARSVAAHPPAAPVLRLWQDPDLAARMWLVHNRALVAYARANPERTLVIHNEALLDGFPLARAINERFGISLNQSAPTGIRPEARRGGTWATGVDARLRVELDDTWADLVSLAGGPPDTPVPESRPVPHDPPSIVELFETHGFEVNEDFRWPVDETRERLAHVETHGPATGARSARIELGEALLISGRPHEALAQFEAALGSAKADGRVMSAIGRTHLQMHQHQAAADSLRSAMKLAPDPVHIRGSLARCLILRGRHTEAGELLAQLVADHPAAPVGPVLLCELLLRQGRPEDATDVAAQAVRALPNSLEVHAAHARALHRAEQTEQALSVGVAASEQFPEHVGILGLVASLFHACNRHDEGDEAAKLLAATALGDPAHARLVVEAVGRVPSGDARRNLAVRVGEHVSRLIKDARGAPASLSARRQ